MHKLFVIFMRVQTHSLFGFLSNRNSCLFVSIDRHLSYQLQVLNLSGYGGRTGYLRRVVAGDRLSNLPTMSAKTYTLNNGLSIPAIGGCYSTRVPPILIQCPNLIAFGGWGGHTDKDRDQFAPTFGMALKVGIVFALSFGQMLTRIFTGGVQTP